MNLEEIKAILRELGFEERFNTEQTAVCVYVFLEKQKGMVGLRIHDIITYARELLNKTYAENTRESIRKGSMKRLVNHGLLILNPDDPTRAINSGLTNYALEPSFRKILENPNEKILITKWKESHKGLVKDLKKTLEEHEVNVEINGKTIKLSSGLHNILIRDIVEVLIKEKFSKYKIFYVGDTKNKQAYVDSKILKDLQWKIVPHDKLPDVMGYSKETNKLLVIESVTSVGAFEKSRVKEIEDLINKKVRKKLSKVHYVTAFLNKNTFSKFSKIIALETKVWIAEDNSIVTYSDKI